MANSTYYYQDAKTESVHKEAIICNEIEFEPIYRYDQLLWKLMTPIPFIRALNLKPENIAIITEPLMQIQIQQKKKNIDLTSLIFNTAEDFEKYIYIICKM